MLARDNFATSLFPLLLAGLLAAMTFWLERAARPPLTGMDGKTRHDPDYLIDKFTVRRFGPEGLLQHTLHADHMRHFPDDDSTLVLKPELTYHRTPATHVSAQKAYLDSGATHIKLVDDVVVRRAGINKPEMVLTTQVLDAFPDEETASTDAPVTITQGQSNVHGSGLRADNKIAQYVLTGPVNGIFHRNGATPAIVSPPPVKAVVAKPKAAKQKSPSRSKR
ncbi:MAG: LPS export ABC transporter periplasmic protein LptC [Rhodocyclaceae bacterium]|nr:LPS export ABC transporter periplasmic protein LptC [Rhodocyclaceae bacterium]MDZ4213817.1 LPS export ABC transporter periplasmic protein LptC [Rhodocyclaceae bacterium]